MPRENIDNLEMSAEDRVAKNVDKLSPKDSESFIKGLLKSKWSKALLTAAMLSMPGAAKADDLKIDSNIKYKGQTYTLEEYGQLVVENYHKMMEKFAQNDKGDEREGENIQVAQK